MYFVAQNRVLRNFILQFDIGPSNGIMTEMSIARAFSTSIYAKVVYFLSLVFGDSSF